MKMISLMILACLCVPSLGFADPPQKTTAGNALTKAEQKFADLMQNATLSGKFSMDLQPDALPKAESYSIEKARKLQGDEWIIEARIRVGENELPIPVPVQIKWAGDTPMLQLTDLAIPLVGEGFTARILFYGDRYAGIWQHGKMGGHLWGVVQHAAAGDPSAQPVPGIPVENDGSTK